MSAGDCQRPACGLPLFVTMANGRLHFLHIMRDAQGIEVRTRTGRYGCRSPKPLRGTP